MEWQDKAVLVRSLKGAAAHCLLALLGAGRPLSFEELRLATGYSKPSLESGLAMLELAQLVARERECWALLAASYTLFVGHSPPDSAIEKNFFALLSSSMQEDSFQVGKKKKEEAPEREEIFALLASAGVGPRSRKMGELLDSELEPAYVRAHIEHRKAALQRGEDYPVGWLITKLLAGDPAPAAMACRCGHCEACQARIYERYPHIQH